MNVIFLDIDGVLTLAPDYRFSEDCLRNLGRLIKKTCSKIVICSSWKEDTLEKTVSKLPAVIRENAVAQTPVIPGSPKGAEVQAWIDANGCESYVILDDEPGGYLPYQRSFRLVTTDCKTGLNDWKCNEAIWTLKH